MKNLDLNAFGVEEVNELEVLTINGGCSYGEYGCGGGGGSSSSSSGKKEENLWIYVLAALMCLR